jgi:hypothetical protein
MSAYWRPRVSVQSELSAVGITVFIGTMGPNFMSDGSSPSYRLSEFAPTRSAWLASMRMPASLEVSHLKLILRFAFKVENQWRFHIPEDVPFWNLHSNSNCPTPK